MFTSYTECTSGWGHIQWLQQRITNGEKSRLGCPISTRKSRKVPNRRRMKKMNIEEDCQGISKSSVWKAGMILYLLGWSKQRLTKWKCISRPLVEDDLQWKITFGGRRPSVEDNLRWKTTFGRRQPSVKDNLWWKMTFGEREPLVEDNLGGRRPLVEDDLQWKTT